ncbi:MAG: sugar ABC transporter permease [Synergistetes bacterium]|nr:sugar ABC transporter permease [Synergistota bacterium]
MAYPLVQALILTFTSEGGAGLTLANWHSVFSDPMFWEALKNTLLLTGVIIPLQVLLALLLALFVNSKFRGYMIVIYLITIPLALSDVSAALMSYNIFSPQGYLNKVLLNLGLIHEPIYFFGFNVKSREFWIIVLTEVWRATPLVFVILLAGLQMIGKEYFEAADVFGFSRLQKFFYITLPLLKTSLQSALLLRTLFAFQIFGVVWLLAGRDIPILAGETFYQQTELQDYNVAAVYGVIIAIISVIISWFYLTFLKGAKELSES